MSNSKRIKSSQGSQAQHPSQTQMFSLESRSATLKFFLILTGKFTVGLYEDFYISQATVTLLLEPDTKPKYCMTWARAAMLPKNREHGLTVVSKTVMGQKNLSHPMSSPRMPYAICLHHRCVCRIFCLIFQLNYCTKAQFSQSPSFLPRSHPR